MWTKNGKEKETSLTIIGKGLVVRGQFFGEGNLQVGGQLEGRIDLSGTVLILEGAKVQADISATEITVAGVVWGNLAAVGKAEVSATGQLLGDVRCKAMIIREGAVVNGSVNMGAASPPREFGELASLSRRKEASDF